MTLQFRRKLLAFFVFLFVIFGVGALYYSQGYRLDLSTFTVQKTGAIYIESYVKPVEIYLNDKQYRDKSGFFKDGTLIQSILPKKYRLVIKKEGYQEYEKNIEVFPTQVVRLFNTLLVPITPATTTPLNTLATSSQQIIDIEGQQALTYDAKSKIYKLQSISGQTLPIDATAKIKTLTKQTFSDIRLNPSRPNALLATSTTGIYSIDLQNNTILTLFNRSYTYFAPLNGRGFIISGNTTPSPSPKAAPRQPKTASPTPATTTEMERYPELDIINLENGNPIFRGRLPILFGAQDIAQMQATSNHIAFVLKNGNVWLQRIGTNEATQIAHSAKLALFSPDGKKLLFQDKDNKVYVYFIDQEIEALGVKAEETIRLTLIDTASLKNIQWYADSFHLILEYPNSKIMIAELTTTEPNNHFVISAIPYDRVEYRTNENVLLFTSQGKISTLDVSFETL